MSPDILRPDYLIKIFVEIFTWVRENFDKGAVDLGLTPTVGAGLLVRPRTSMTLY